MEEMKSENRDELYYLKRIEFVADLTCLFLLINTVLMGIFVFKYLS